MEADLLDAESLEGALEGVESAFYLVHSMAEGSGFEAHDRMAATNFALAARAAGVRRIVYLGGLGNEDETLSPICAVVTKLAASSANQGRRWLNSAPRSSSDPAACRLKW